MQHDRAYHLEVLAAAAAPPGLDSSTAAKQGEPHGKVIYAASCWHITLHTQPAWPLSQIHTPTAQETSACQQSRQLPSGVWKVCFSTENLQRQAQPSNMSPLSSPVQLEGLQCAEDLQPALLSKQAFGRLSLCSPLQLVC